MALQNIGAANSDDAFYRYKMPRMITKIEGRGNGIKTNIVNMVDIAKALARPASYTTKYFGCELGAQSKFDEKTGTSLVNGAHETVKLAALLENFIKKYVQCYGCGNPETEIIITKSQMLTLKCAACGFISDVDMRDKLTTFILKNPPEQKKGGKEKKGMRRAEKERLKEGEAADEELKKKKDVKKKATTSSKDSAKATVSKKKASGSSDEEHNSASPVASLNGDDNADDDDDVEWQTDTSIAAAQQRIQEQLSAVTAEMVVLTTEETVQEKKSQAPKTDDAHVNGNAKSASVNGSDALVVLIKNKLSKRCTPVELQKYLTSQSGTTSEIMIAVFEALFEGVGKGFSKEVGKKKNYITTIVQDETGQMFLLQAIEAFCGKCSPDAVKEVALVLKFLYDEDILEEEIIIKWYNEALSGGKMSQALKNAKPFVEWLQNAESESDEE